MKNVFFYVEKKCIFLRFHIPDRTNMEISNGKFLNCNEKLCKFVNAVHYQTQN